MSNIETHKLEKKATLRLQWHGDDATRVLIAGNAEKMDVNPGDVIEVGDEQARSLFAYSDLWTLEGETPVEQPWRVARKNDAIRQVAEAKARERARAKREAAKSGKPVEDEDDKEPEVEPLTEADVDLMTTKVAVSNALKARKVAHNARGASLDELKALLKENLAPVETTETEGADKEGGDGEGEDGEKDAE